MVDIDIIRENYSRMPDAQLLKVASEGSTLTHEAFIVLKREIKKRGLSTAIIEEQDQLRVENAKERIRANINEQFKDHNFKVWSLAFDSKAKGLSDYEIQLLLIKEGVAGEDAIALTAKMPGIADHILKTATGTIAAENVWLLSMLVAGVALFFMSVKIIGLYVLVVAKCIHSIRQLSISSAEKEKFEKIIAAYREENKTVETPLKIKI